MVAAAMKEQRQMKTLLEQKSIELKKNVLLNEELTDRVERLSQDRDNIMAERNKLAMEQQTLVADKEVGMSVMCVISYVCAMCMIHLCVSVFVCVHVSVFVFVRVYICICLCASMCVHACMCVSVCVRVRAYLIFIIDLQF